MNLPTRKAASGQARSGKTASFSGLSNLLVHVPEVGMHTDLQSAISFLQGEAHIALDNYEAAGSLPQLLPESAKRRHCIRSRARLVGQGA